MEVKIGVQHAQRELVVDTDISADELEAKLAEALSGNGVFTLHDTKGRRVVVPSASIAYLELGNPSAGAVGFR